MCVKNWNWFDYFTTPMDRNWRTKICSHNFHFFFLFLTLSSFRLQISGKMAMFRIFRSFYQTIAAAFLCFKQIAPWPVKPFRSTVLLIPLPFLVLWSNRTKLVSCSGWTDRSGFVSLDFHVLIIVFWFYLKKHDPLLKSKNPVNL